MPGKDIPFRDDFQIISPSEEQIAEWKDSYGYTPTRALRVKFKASHSAIINKNNRFYIPAQMEKGVSNFTAGKPAPILKHHKKDEDPVGKVVDARYVPTIPETLVGDPLVRVLTDLDASPRKQLKAAKLFMRNDFARDPSWEGLGFTEITADIYDEKTIQQLQDRLFDAVSVGFNSDHVFCSHCESDWLDLSEGQCRHKLGEFYSSEDNEQTVKDIAVLVFGQMFFKENSLVNFDADPHTAVEIPQLGDADKNNVEFTDEVSFTKGVQELKNGENDKEAANMSKSTDKDSAPNVEPTKYFDKVCEVIKSKFTDLEEVKVKEAAARVDVLFDDEGFLPDQKDAELELDTAILYTYEALDTNEEDIDADAVYADLEKELEKMAEEKIISDEELADAKLSSEQRKRLKTTTFCGPKRSFPVPDCAHVTAARRLIGRYKGPGNKSTILACVSRKANALGCKSSSDSVSEPPTHNDKECNCEIEKFKDLHDKDLKTIFYAVNMELSNRDLAVGVACKDCATNVKDATESKKLVNDLNEKITSQDETIAFLRDELRSEFMNFKSLSNDYVDLGLSMRNLKLKYAAVVSVAAGEQDSLEIACKHFSDMEDFEKQYEDFVLEEKVAKIVNELHDGTTGEPEGTVETPVENQDKDNTQGDAELSKTETAIIKRCKEYIDCKDIGNSKALFARMKTMGVLRDSLTWEKATLAADDAGK